MGLNLGSYSLDFFLLVCVLRDNSRLKSVKRSRTVFYVSYPSSMSPGGKPFPEETLRLIPLRPPSLHYALHSGGAP